MSAAAVAAAFVAIEPARRFGFVRKVAPGRIEASGPLSAIGDICEIDCPNSCGMTSVLAEVVAVEDDRIVLVPIDSAEAVVIDSRVVALGSRNTCRVGDAFAGRAVDALGNPIDGAGPLRAEANKPASGSTIRPLDRCDPGQQLETGIRAIDGLLTLGVGQRIGVFSASGVGKTTLLRQLAMQTECEHCVVCLVGERGREVQQFWTNLTGTKAKSRFTCVAATSDLSAPLRARAVHQALCLAEYWRDRGKKVLLVLDSVTRFAMALRELGLAAGAPPTLRAYTPNVFAALPRLTERCGALASGGSITAVVSVLSESDDVDDPIVEVMKSLLDGHIILSRQLAEQGQFPAIDIVRSVSRQSDRLMNPDHAAAARRAAALLATYDEARVLIECGLYKAGTNPQLDEAMRERPGLLQFLRQRADESSTFSATLDRLRQSVSRRGGQHA